MTLNFSKMHGLGNDYIYFDCTEKGFPEPEKAAVFISDRHFGVGGDGIVLIERPNNSDNADFRMRMFNADGSEAEMCGNAVRCVAKFLFEKGLTSRTQIPLETKAGLIQLNLVIEENESGKNVVKRVKVNMGVPILDPQLIPTTFSSNPPLSQKLIVDEKEFTVNLVSMGNPHCVIFVDKITDELVLKWGPRIEVAPQFPKKINVEFVEVLSKDRAKMRVWERGSGETLACGTGASAVVVAGNLTGRLDKQVEIELLGGKLEIEIDENNFVWKTGPACFVFEGSIQKCW
ncbi:MAG TPA: diaminopimelate epimerase [Oligoflexia bacterium]|nr:diaminopimelate epimerase [Oligoflexia bacterium]HMP47569.1 diaminopimelate epimerase [Oligoflexia bacterium]